MRPRRRPHRPAAVTPPPLLKEGDDCPDSTLAVKGITSQPEYVVGDQPKFTMVVTNIGLVACKRDVGAAVLAAYVYSLDNNRLWSNLDCAPSNETLVKTFNPGEQVTTEVTWTGMGSAPQCPMPRQPIGPGTSNLMVQLGNLRSAPVPFILAQPNPQQPGPPPARALRRLSRPPRAAELQASRSAMVDSASRDRPSRMCRAHIDPIPSTDCRSSALAASSPCSEPNERTSRSTWANCSRGIPAMAR